MSGNHVRAGEGNDTHRSPCTITTGNKWCGLTSPWRKVAPCVSPVHSTANPQNLKNGSRAVLLDFLGHHGAACSSVGELFAAESAVAQICREAALECPQTSCWDLDISPPHNSDGRRLEVAEGLCWFGGCQLALYATVVSTLHGDEIHRRKADVED